MKHRSIHINAVLNYYTEGSLYDDESKNAVRDSVLFIIYTGCRINEVETLKWENIDIEKGFFVFKNPKMEMTVYFRGVIIFFNTTRAVEKLFRGGEGTLSKYCKYGIIFFLH
ncbi:site-specific integrase [Acinetobacter pollinis]|jgi:integrase|uniref:hypothetical protein n=1 Tax=Acinetobacter pollinis TaxID=2605270 RepID=UPI0018A328CE|nr:hypothetical protein [Acinetobacter pollinis]MBF7693653.1 hypothetical protein [Acinetobacter pollinis]MBF7699112.1 hypothetical protein [Acinetobacter pollinis]MBF7701717.1 hypothetical protein [Acinetobacter pollinis]